MAYFDFPLEVLKAYKPELAMPDDFDSFWEMTLSEARKHPLGAKLEPVHVHLKTLNAFDLTFSGYGGQAIKGWLLMPKDRDGPLPCIVEYIGYGGGRGFANDWLLFASAGYAHFVMDTRGQGSSWRQGDTPDLGAEGSSPHSPGFMTLGVLEPKTYYYRRLITDAVRAVEAAQSFDELDASRIAVTGGSQGGGLTLAVAGLVPNIKLALPDVPFLCHYRRATEIVDTAPYAEIQTFLKVHRDKLEQVFATLSYFDGLHFAKKARASALFSLALMDTICPPSTTFAAYNHYAGPKDLRIYPYNNHEGGQSYHTQEKLAFLAAHLP